MKLTEVQRQEYLQIMGIQSYFPRYQLPGARVSIKVSEAAENSSEQEALVQAVEFDANSASPELSNAQQQLSEPQEQGLRAEMSSQALSSIQQKSSELEVDSPSHGGLVQNENPVAVKETDNLEIDVRFRLLVFRVSEKICVLNQVPHVGLNQPLYSQHRSLFNNICSALKLTQTPIEFDQGLFFSWPFEVQANLDNGSMSAQSGIKAYLEQQHSVQPFDTLIVMGEVMSKYCSATSFPQAQTPWNTVNTPSLDEMLKAWQFKRDAWKKLRRFEFHQ